MKIVFTSCMDAERVPEQPIWRRIAQSEEFDVLMLLGDQIYMDWGDLGASGWRELIAGKPDKGLEAFAIEMHRRYALQWGVAAFQQLICGFAGRADPARLLLTWDDHDYAWNNSLGVDGADDAHRHGVPARVKAVSSRLFGQFVQQLRGAAPGSTYPVLPENWNAPLPAGEPGDLFWSGLLGDASGPPCLLLDTRWYRQARAPDASLLGPQQAQQLRAAVAAPDAGLLVVAAGTPMAYHYLLSQQAWQAHGQPAYREYDEVLGAARRPVLFLGGDVHRNAWSGRLAQTHGGSSRVVQLLSSGAAIGSYGPKRFAPSYGVVTVPDSWATGGEVGVALWAQDKAGQWRPDPPMAPLRFGAGDWAAALHGEAQSRLDATADAQPLAILAARVRRSGANQFKQVVPAPKGIDDLDDVYANTPPDGQAYPEPLELQAQMDSDGAAELRFMGNISQGDGRPAEIQAVIRAAFARALQAQRKSVVLFLHGFGKSFVAGVAQAYGLRATFPECEPILYSWEAGRAGGVFAALTGVARAQQAAVGGEFGVREMLKAFNAVAGDAAYAGLAKVVLARSAGSLALHQALVSADINFGGQLAHVDRVLLSAPLMRWSEFKRNGSFRGLQRPVVVTRNQNDQTLAFANWFDGPGPIIGREPGFVSTGADKICLDFTGSAGVGRLHDYLCLEINPSQIAVHRALLTQKHFDPHAAAQQGLLQAAGHGIFNVH